MDPRLRGDDGGGADPRLREDDGGGGGNDGVGRILACARMTVEREDDGGARE